MLPLMTENPWLVVCALAAAVIVACTAIVLIPEYLRQARQAEIDSVLKQDMLNRGMSAADIKTVLEASTDGEVARNQNQPVRVGLGKFQFEVGAVDRPAAADADSPARSG